MSSSPEIYCDLCGYQFKVYPKQETEVEDHELVDVTRYYPLESENAHLVCDYVCDSCYKQIGDIVKQSLVKAGEEYIDKLQDRLDKAHQEYLNNIKTLKSESAKIEQKIMELKKSNIVDFTKDQINNYTRNNYPYALKGTYYLKKAVEIEKRNKLNLKDGYEWEKELGISIISCSKEYSKYNLISKDDFFNLLLDCQVKNKTIKEILELIELNR